MVLKPFEEKPNTQCLESGGKNFSFGANNVK
jgi:hypothetical protein